MLLRLREARQALPGRKQWQLCYVRARARNDYGMNDELLQEIDDAVCGMAATYVASTD